ncbi:MAG: hypothetical protein WCX65_04760 [bacterium]
MKIIFPNLIASIRVLTGSLAFLIFILIASIRGMDLNLIFFCGIFTYLFFYLLGAIVSGILAQINKEIEIEPIGEKTPDHETELKRHLDMMQGAEMPIFD